MPVEEILGRAAALPSWTSQEERRLLSRLASEVPAGGLILEVGCLYGGMTAVLALSNPAARLTCIDNFSWNPQDRALGPEALISSLSDLGVERLPRVIRGDSRQVGRGWTEPIELLWIDGGHSYEFVRSDLDQFGPHAQVIALHDFGNPAWARDVMRAVAEFLSGGGWLVSEVADYTVVLRRGSIDV